MYTLVHGHALGCVLMKNLSLSFRITKLEDFKIERLQNENISKLEVLGARDGYKRNTC